MLESVGNTQVGVRGDFAVETQHITLVTKAHNGTITVRTEIPVSDEADTYLVTIAVAPQPPASSQPSQTLDQLYGALADTPLPEITTDPLPEERDEV